MTYLAKVFAGIVAVGPVIILIYLSCSIGYKDARKIDKNIVQRSKNGYNIITIDPYDVSTNDIERLFDDHNVILFHYQGRLILEAWQ